MKKKIIGITIIAAIAIVAGWNVSQSQDMTNLSNLALSNVEALAENESSKNDKALAQKTNGDYCCAKKTGNNCTSSPDC